MSHIAILHPQCARLGGAIQMALQTAQVLIKQGHKVVVYTFEKNDACFPELQTGLDIRVWPKKNEENDGNEENEGNGGIFKKSISLLSSLLFFLSPKSSNIITLAFHLRHVDIIIANNPPMQIVAALTKFFVSRVQTLWWHHHVPWYMSPEAKNTNEQWTMYNVQWRNLFKNPQLHITHYTLHISKFFKRFVERNFVIPRIDQMIATSYFVAEKIQIYCGREATVIHPVLQTITIPLPSTDVSSPLKGAPETGVATVASPPYKGEERSEGGFGIDTKPLLPTWNEYPLVEGEPGSWSFWYFSYPANSHLKPFAHQMSREMTRAEQRLWFEVLQSEKTGYKWVKQKIIWNFIVDFYCHEKRLVIEVDGWVHQEQEYYDTERTKYLEKLGIRVIRYTNEIVLNQIDQVRERILWDMGKAPVPLSRGGESENERGGLVMGTGSVTVFTHGRLEPGKGIDMIIRVWERLQTMTNEEWRMKNEGMVSVIPGTQVPSVAGDLHDPESRRINTRSDSLKIKGNFNDLDLPAGRQGSVFQRNDGDARHCEEYNDKATCLPAGRSMILVLEPGSPRPPVGRPRDDRINLVIFWTGSLEKELQEKGINVRPFDRKNTFPDMLSGQYWHVLGVYCSQIDSFGMAPLEAQAAGISTIILDSGGARETILTNLSDEHVGYLVDSEEELFRTIAEYVQIKSFPKKLSNVNFSHTREYFTPERLSRDIGSIIEKTRV